MLKIDLARFRHFSQGFTLTLTLTLNPAVSEESMPSDCSFSNDSVAHNNPKDSSYYASEEWQQEIDAALHTFQVIQPSQQPSSCYFKQTVQLSNNQF